MQITANKVTIKGTQDLVSLGVTITETSTKAEKPVENAKPIVLDTEKLTEEQQKTVSDFLALLEPKAEEAGA